MALITKEELIIYLDLPRLTQPTDRAQLVCDLVIQAVNRAAGVTLAAPFADGLKGIALLAAARLYDNPIALRTKTIGGTSSVYAGDVSSILTPGEKDEIRAATGVSGPQGNFPAWDWSWTTVPASALTD